MVVGFFGGGAHCFVGLFDVEHVGDGAVEVHLVGFDQLDCVCEVFGCEGE